MHKRFGDLHVLRGIDLRVAKGSVVCVLGPSGSGKSTLLRCVNLLEPPDEGRIVLEGKEITGEARGDDIDYVRRRVGMVFQQFNLFPHKSRARQRLPGAGEGARSLARGGGRRRRASCSTASGLSDKADEYPDRLSGGQQQRVAIARALAMDPHVMLFDEVTSALDPELIKEVLDVHARPGGGGHDDDRRHARDAASRATSATDVVFMDEGVIVEEGPPEEVIGTRARSAPGASRARARALSPAAPARARGP